jgi:dephospho-CoA kinase
VVEVPLLAEAPQFAGLADVVVAITACESTRVDRAVARGMARSDVTRRVAVQATDAARAALADVVIENEGTLEQLYDVLGRFWDDRIEASAESGADDG